MKLILAVIAAFLISFVWGFLAHGMLLRPEYAQLPALFRPDSEAMAYLPYLFLSHLVKGFAFAWVYRQGITPGVPWLLQGFRFGIIASLLIVVPLYLVYFAVQPVPATVVTKQMLADTVGTMLMALAVAFILRPADDDA
jgi:hypothetical protein